MTNLSKQDYLKRYLSPQENNDHVKKKRKKMTGAVKKVQGFKIVDDDVGWDTLAPKPDEFDEVNDKLLTVDEKPQIENIDVRTEEEKKMDEYRRSKMWKKLDADESQLDDEQKESDGDLDVPRSKQRRKQRHDSDSDLDDVPRRIHQQNDSDLDDIPRSNRKKASRANNYDSDSDLDVARPTKKPSRRRHDSDSDLDTLPRQKHRDSKRQSRHDSDIDLPRKKRSSKSRKRHDSDSDLEVKRNNTTADSTKKSDMQSGGRGGLTSVDLLRMEMQKLQKKESAMKVMAEEYKNTATVYRERGSGKKRDMAKEQKDDEAENLRKKQKQEQYNKWGRGLKQAAIKAGAIADTLHESNKSLTRYADDEDLEAMRKAEMRPDDPMAEYIMRKKQKEKGKVNDRPRYKGPAPEPNRYNIMPGYRWDGVDRSNGFEKKYYQSLSDKQALKDEYYKWSVGDM